MEREACVCDHGYERSDLCAEIIIIIIIIIQYYTRYQIYNLAGHGVVVMFYCFVCIFTYRRWVSTC